MQPDPVVVNPFRPPYAAAPVLAFLRARAIPGVELVDGYGYRRVIGAGEGAGRVDIRLSLEHNNLEVRVSRPDGLGLAAVARRVSQVFDTEVDPEAVACRLRADAVLRPRLEQMPGLRVPGAWDAFELGVRAILGQQVTVKGASTLAGRLVALCGQPLAAASDGLTHAFPTPVEVAGADLSRIGLPVRRQETLREFSRAAAAGMLTLPAQAVVTALHEIPGIGDWTTQYMLMRAWRDPDAFPASDLWLRRSAGEESVRALVARAEQWRPWRAYAAMYLWQVPTA